MKSGREPSLGGDKKRNREEARLAGDRAVLHMVEMLDDPDPIVRERAALALGEMGDQRAFEALVEMARGPSRVVSNRALRALANFTTPHHFESQLAMYWDIAYPDVACRVIACDREKAFEAFTASLSDQDGRIRDLAAWALENFDDRDMVPLFLGLLEDPDPNVRRRARYALSDRPDARAVPAMLALLNSPDFHEIQTAAITLGRIGDRCAVQPLLPLALGGYARHQAAYALRLLGDREAVAAITAVAINREEDPERRLSAVDSLGIIGERASVGPLVRIYDDPSEDRQLRLKILEVIGEIGGEEAEERLAQEFTNTDAEVRRNVFRGLSEIYTERSARLILTLVDDPDPRIQAALAEQFEQLSTQINPQEDWPAQPFIDALHSDRPTLRKYAVQALSHIGTDDAVTAIAAAFGDPAPEVRAAVLRALAFRAQGVLHSTGFFEAMLPLLNADDQDLRIATMYALPKRDDPRGIERMIALVDDPDPVIRHHAINLLGFLGATEAIPAMIRHLNDIAAPPGHLIDTVGLPTPYMGGRVCDVAAAMLNAFRTSESVAAVDAWLRRQGVGE